VDKIYFVDNFEPEECTGAANVKTAGKRCKCCAVARMLGENVRLTGFKGGETGNWLESQLKKLGVVTRFVEVSGETRTTTIL